MAFRVAWLRGRRGARVTAPRGGLDSLLTTGFWSAPSPGGEAPVPATVSAAVPGSVSARLAADPAAAAQRARWEARWDEF
jgi:hypothetical protein